MFVVAPPRTDSKAAFYDDLAAQLEGLLGDEADAVANAANTAALIFAQVADLNWAGFYLLRGDELVVGPFQASRRAFASPWGAASAAPPPPSAARC